MNQTQQKREKARAAEPGNNLLSKASLFAEEKLGWNITAGQAYKQWDQGQCVHANKLTKQQKQVITSIEHFPRTAVKSTHSMGKSVLIGFLGAWWLAKKKHNIVLVCSAKEEQTLRILMPKIKFNWLKAFPETGNRDDKKALRDIIQPNKTLNPEWMTLVISGRNTETWQGYHASYGGELLLIIDEGSKMTPQLAYASEGLISGGGARLVILGNALCEDKNAPFRLAFGDPTFNAITWSPFDHENMWKQSKRPQYCTTCDLPVYQGCISPRWIDEQKQKYGENSKTYKMRVLAEFPEPVEYGKRWIIDPEHVADAAGIEYTDIHAEDLEQTRNIFLENTEKELIEEGFTTEQTKQWMQAYHS